MNVNKQRGVALLEVLISIIILSIGMLGVAALQFSTLKTYQQTNFDIQAQMAFSSLREEMQVVRDHLVQASGVNVAATFNARFVDKVSVEGSVLSVNNNDWMINWVSKDVLPMLPALKDIEVAQKTWNSSNVYVVQLRWAVTKDDDGRSNADITESYCPESLRKDTSDTVYQCFIGYFQPEKTGI